MVEIEMPEGTYLSLAVVVRPGGGGQTRALLMRNRLFARRAGLSPKVLSFDDPPVYPEVREVLRAEGHLVDHLEPNGEDLLELDGFDLNQDLHPDGSVYRTRHMNQKNGKETAIDYHRADGSVFLRAPSQSTVNANPVTPFVLVNAKGEPVRQWPKKGGWHRQWLQDLTEGISRVFVISDSRFATPHVLPLRDPRFHVLHLMHNIHVGPPQRWDSPMSSSYVQLLDRISHMDALVTLTHRQREDISTRFGETNNMFVVPNPVETPPLPDPLPRREVKRLAVVSRLETQKRLDDAIRAFALVVAQEPDARLDIYGEGTLRIRLQELTKSLGLEDSVVLHGYDPKARETLWTATAFLMTSVHEGYPLATLESMSHGCPVISYDIKYGPREQITEGVDGFLVEEGDIEAIADRALLLIRDPDRVTAMSKAAYAKALAHDHTSFIHDWQQVLNAVVEQKAAARRSTRSLSRCTPSATCGRRFCLAVSAGRGPPPRRAGSRSPSSSPASFGSKGTAKARPWTQRSSR